MDQSAFARLPKELRLIIYEYALFTDCSINISWWRRIAGFAGRARPVELDFRLCPVTDSLKDECSGSTIEGRQNTDPTSDISDDSESSSGVINPRGCIGNTGYGSSDSDSDEGEGWQPQPEPKPISTLASLTATCRQLRTEAMPVFYAIHPIIIASNYHCSSEFPTLQAIMLNRWLRDTPSLHSGFFRHITIEVWYDPVSRLGSKSISFEALAEEIYQRFSEIACCFDSCRTQLSLDLGGYQEPDPWYPRKLHIVSRVFMMTSVVSLRQQIEAHISESESTFRKAKTITKWQDPFRTSQFESMLSNARSSHKLLRQLITHVERVEQGLELGGP